MPETLQEAIIYFSDVDAAHDTTCALVWPNGAVCIHCGGIDPKLYKYGTKRLFRCTQCNKQFTVKRGTIFEDSPLGLDKWLMAIWMIANCKNGVSSYEIHRALGITQKSAWFMLHRIRLAMKTGTFQKLSGEVEVDETYVGGKEINRHASKRMNMGRGIAGKAVVAGVLERPTSDHNSRVRAKLVPDTTKTSLHGLIRANVESGTNVYTDAHRSYRGLSDQYMHGVVDHAIEYVRGQVHTNGLENFWSLLKRSIKGTYVSVNINHLDSYLDEQSFRYNERVGNDSDRFQKTLQCVAGKRLTYKELTGNSQN